MAIDINALYNALIGLESGGRQSAVNSRTKARGVSQILPGNWNPWSKEVFGRVVPQTEESQRMVTKHKLQEYWDAFGSPQAALAAWFAGPDDGRGYARGDRRTMKKSDGNMTVEQYVNTIYNRALSYAGEGGNTRGNAKNRMGSGGGVFDAEQKLTTWLDELSHALAGGQRENIDDVIIPEFTQATDLTANVDAPEEVAVEQGQEEGTQPILGFYDPTKDLWDFAGNEAQLTSRPAATDDPSLQELITFDEQGNPDLSQLQIALSKPGDLGIPVDGNVDWDSVDRSTGGSKNGQEAVDLATEYLGVPYKWGGTSPSGFDCSGLLQYVYAKMGVRLPRVSRDQAKAGSRVASLADAQPGDLISFAKKGRPVHHIGMYVGNGKMLHAPSTGKNVQIVSLGSRVNGIHSIRRVV